MHARLQHGDFDSIASAEKLAGTLTDVVQRETRDKHIEVRYFEKAIPEQPQGQDEPADDRAAELLKDALNAALPAGAAKYAYVAME